MYRHRLCISDLPEFDLEREMLRIDSDPKAGQFKLEYQVSGNALSAVQALEKNMFTGAGVSIFRPLPEVEKLVPPFVMFLPFRSPLNPQNSVVPW